MSEHKTEATYYEIWRHDPNGDTKLGTFDTEKACRDAVEEKALPKGSYHYIEERVVDLSEVDLSKEIAVALTRPDYPEGVKNVIRLCCDEIDRLNRQLDGYAYVIHAGACEMCNPMNRPNTICSHGAKLLESARPGATAGMKVMTYA